MRKYSTVTQKPSPPAAVRKPKQKPKQLFEYMLLITPRYNDRKKLRVTHVGLRTVKEFSNFRYELVAAASVRDNTLLIDIKGLRAPQLTLPDVGPAVFETEFDNLRGTYEVKIQKLRKEINLFRVNISPEKVTLEKVPGKRFVDIVTRAEDW